jgi:2-methylcitrate dehydratase PrpD
MGIAVKVLAPFFGPPQASVIGRGERPDAFNAAFLNAISANVLEYDDTHLETVMHPAAPVAPGLFALAELPVSGRELLHAFILGVEISCRVGLGVMPTHYRRGWHITATCGVFGAADRVVVRGHPLMRERTDRPNVETGRDARVSLQNSAAAALLFGAAGLAQYEDDCVADAAVRTLRAKVVFEEDRPCRSSRRPWRCTSPTEGS